MTYEKALQILLMYCTEECGEIDACRCENKECVEAVVIKALEKQIPKKPRRTNDGLHIAKKDFYTKCQLCNHNFPVVVRDARMRFCPFCGQKIDWRMTNEKSKK